MRASVLCIAGLLAGIHALTITSPTNGETLDPTQPITFSWTSTSSDPDTFDIVLDNADSGGLISNIKVATGVSISSGTYIVSASAATTYGEGFVLRAESSAGDVLATSPSFALSVGSATTIDGHLSYISTQTYTGTVTEGPATATDAAAIPLTTTDSSTATDTANVQATLGQTPDSSLSGDVASATGSSSSSSSFTTSTVSRSGSSTGTSSSSSASASSSQNAQPKLATGSQIAFTAAGLVAGMAALLA